jgi:5S rRNA maturation endonuclease (ribonuclease M5)
MLLKFFNRGTGKGKTAVEYLLKEMDANGVRREPAPELLRGDPQQTIQLIDSLNFKHKYRSGVISFAPSDAPTSEQLEAIMDSFEKTAFAGLDRDRYSILWVKHTHTGDNRVELHFITPRVELTTGKSLNIAPPGWGNYFRPWRDYWNYSQEWASPDDPQRARAYHPGYQALVDASDRRLELAEKSTHTREDYRQIITNYVTENIRLGRVSDRMDAIAVLEKSGFQITRAGEDYITVFNEKIGKKLRLKGGIYSASWRLGQGLTEEARSGQETDRSTALSRIRASQTELTTRIKERVKYHQSRYGENEAVHQCSMEMVSSPASSNSYEPLNRFLHRQLGDDALASQSIAGDSSPKENLRNSQKPNLGSGTVSNEQREIYYPTTVQPGEDQLAMQRPTLSEAVKEDDERVRKRVTANLQELCGSIRDGQEAAKRTNQQLSEANSIVVRVHNHLERTGRAIKQSLSRHHERFRRIKMKRADELERFKTEINLVEYAFNSGYEIDKNKSSQNCIVLKDNAGDKILVGVDNRDRHYFYYSVKDDRDCGSIIDFVQKRKNLNLGEVRLELRPWINNSYSPTSTPTIEPIPKPEPASKDRHKILAQFESFDAIAHHPYLKERGISQQTTNDPRFEGTIYTDSRSNVIFPHRDRDGVCGYEIRNQNFKGFSSGGSKGLWVSQSFKGDRRLVICESPIDCLSYHQLFPNDSTRYFATGGTISELQKDLLRTAFEKLHAKGGQIIIATDRDEAGNKLALELAKIAPESSQIRRDVLEHHKDWNEALQAQIERDLQQQNQPKRDRGRGLSL